jgi:hypothetical protein
MVTDMMKHSGDEFDHAKQMKVCALRKKCKRWSHLLVVVGVQFHPVDELILPPSATQE